MKQTDRAVSADKDAQALFRRAYSMHRSGGSGEAAALLKASLWSSGPSLPTLRLLAEIEHSLGRRQAECAVLQELLTLAPLDAVAWNRMGELSAAGGSWEDAERAYRRACELEPGDFSSWEGLALCAIASGRLNRATDALEHLKKSLPIRVSAHVIAGHVHKAAGQNDRAAAAYRRALSAVPHLSTAIYNLVELQTPPPEDPLVRHTEGLAARQPLGDADCANLRFALGRVYEAAKRHDEAFAHYAIANEATQRVMRQRGIVYNPEATDEHVASTIAAYPVEGIAGALDPLPIDLRLIFIVGMPRSGTTLVEQILSSHPRVRAGGELPFAVECERLHAARRRELGIGGPVDLADERERELLLRSRELYLDRLFERDLDGECVTDKLPGNFARLGLIRLLFPDALIVHCRRDPMATGWSLFTANFAIHEPYYNSLGHLAHFYRGYQRIMSHWRAVLRQPMVEVRYEDLVQDPERKIRRLLHEVGLDWNAQCLASHEHDRPIVTASSQQVRKPINSSSLERWRPFESRLSALAAARADERTSAYLDHVNHLSQ